MKMLETIHILPVRAESAAPAPLRGKKLDQRAVLQVVRKVDWKKAGLIAGGVTVVCAAAGTRDVFGLAGTNSIRASSRASSKSSSPR